jgi:uncharacterized membrane protein YbhN (UPF0104 family)
MSIKKIVSVILVVAIIGAAAFYFLRHKGEFHLISNVSIGAISVLSVFAVILSLCYGVQLKILTDHYRLNLSLLDCFGISRAATFADMWLPFGGTSSLKAVYLKKFHDLRYSSFIASMGIAQIIKIMVNSAVALILLGIGGVKMNALLTAAVGIIFLLTLTFFLLAHKVSKRFFHISGYLETLTDEWRKIRKDHRSIKRLIFLNLLIFVVNSFLVDVAFRAFGIGIPPAASGLISNFTTITGVINLVPANLGIQEGVVMVASGMFGRSVNEGLHAAALMRIVRTIWTLVLAPVFSTKLLKKTE